MKQRYPKKFLLLLLLYIISTEAIAQTYAWKNVKIGAGGFVSGLVFNPAQSNQLYARTDVGGAYRWDAATTSWTPLTDFLGQDDENYSGVISLATDPNDVNRVYMATGLYTQSWAGNGAVFSSTDKGNTWTKHDLTFKLGGNEDGRNSGERLAVDPNKGNILFLGSSKNGLWQSTDHGSSWSQVSSFPVSTFSGAGVSFVLFDKSTGTAGNATQTIYVGIMQTGSANLYKSTDGGVSWSVVSGAITNLMPMQGVLSSNGNMYITYSDAAGPNNISTGAVYKLNTSTGVLTSLTLPSGQGGYAGVHVDANAPNTILVSTIDRWWPRDEIFRSTDGGSTWTALLGSATWDHTSAPYTTGHTAHWIADVEIDPFDSKKAWFVTGYGVYQTADLTASPVTWTFQNNGLEEIVATSLVSPASGVPLLSAVGDQDGFRHVNLDVSPAAGKYNPSYGTHTGIDVGATNSNYVVRVYNNSSGNYGSYSTDQGITWTMFGSYPAGTTGGGSVAVSANGSRIVWSPNGASAVYYSGNNGATWTASTGISSGQVVIADAVNSNKFYGYNALSGVMLVSTDGGATFSNAATGLPTLQSWELGMGQLSTVFGIEGDVWFTSGNNGLYHSVNSGASFSKVSGINVAYKVAFGKAANTAPYPAIYIQGRVSGVYGFFRSIDGGSTWVRINDNAHNFLGIRAFSADPKVFGQVYLGTSGRGLVYGTDLSVLPVLFTRVSVSQRPVSQKVYADVKWQAAAEDATTGYVVERSLDAVHWEEVYRTTANGLNDYTYSDDVTALSGNIRYRIREINKSGYGSYSAIVSLRLSNITRTTVTVRPNPVINNVINLHMSSEAKQHVVVRLTDLHGRTLYTSAM
ncbi:MAG TPA: secretion protein, partial [Niastella sp.]